MSVKKLLVLSAAGLAALGVTVAFAGGPEEMPMPPAAPVFQQLVYIEGNLGYAIVDWRHFSTTPFFTLTHNSEGGFVYGGDIGYQFMRNFAIEGGIYRLPEAEGTNIGIIDNVVYGTFGAPLDIHSWFIYLAGKITVPLYENFDLFGKVGVAYRQLSFNSPTIPPLFLGSPPTQGYWDPVFAGGLNYMFTPNWTANLQYMRVPAFLRNGDTRQAPSANLFTGGVGFQFSV